MNDNDGSDNGDYSFGTILVFKMTNKYTHNMTLMSRCKELLLGEKGPTNSGNGRKNFFYRGRCSFTGCLLDMAGHLEAVGVVAV